MAQARVVRRGQVHAHARRLDALAGAFEQPHRFEEVALRGAGRAWPVSMAEAAPEPLQDIGAGQWIAHIRQGFLIEVRGIQQRPGLLGLGCGRQAERHRFF